MARTMPPLRLPCCQPRCPMEVGEREAEMYDQYFQHGELGCCFHRAPLPVVALLRGAPHEATADGVRILTHGGRHGIQCPTVALFTGASGRLEQQLPLLARASLRPHSPVEPAAGHCL